MAAQTGTDTRPYGGPRTVRPVPQVDGAELWRWVWASVYPAVGYLLVLLGLALIALAWWGVSRNAIVAKQVPYLASGGLFGIGAIVLGGRFLVIQDLRRDAARLDRLEAMMSELHRALLVASDAAALDGPGVAAEGPGATPSPRRPRTARSYLVVPGGVSYHREGCPMLEGKGPTDRLGGAALAKRGLAPCPLCEPEPAT